MTMRARWAGLWLLMGAMACGGKAVDEPAGGNAGGSGGLGGSGARAGNGGSGAVGSGAVGSGAVGSGSARKQAEEAIETVCSTIEDSCPEIPEFECRESGLDYFDEAGDECEEIALTYFQCIAEEMSKIPGCAAELELCGRAEAELDDCSGIGGDCVGGRSGGPGGVESCDIDCGGVAARCTTDPSGIVICRCENSSTSFSLQSCDDLADFVEEACG